MGLNWWRRPLLLPPRKFLRSKCWLVSYMRTYARSLREGAKVFFSRSAVTLVKQALRRVQGYLAHQQTPPRTYGRSSGRAVHGVPHLQENAPP